jgi:GMP synthase-like glutamine amidotransferase
MKPVAIFRHHRNEGPGYLGAYLDARGVPWALFRIDQSEKVPDDPRAFSGVVFMGGPMSVNDDLPWIAPALALIRTAAAAGVPVLGHCLGGQLMAKALGGTVGRNPVKEIGWGRVSVEPVDVADRWFGGIREFEGFHWHGETFSIPDGATCIASSAHCANQAFALGPHLALQCHVEMTEDLIRSWAAGGEPEIREARMSPAVQTAAEMTAGLDERLPELHAVADRLYDRWTAGLVR